MCVRLLLQEDVPESECEIHRRPCYVCACSVNKELFLIQFGLDNTDCAVTFVLQYFFATASSVWWLILTFTWLLAAGWKWSHEAIACRACGFHMLGWAVPSALTVAVLIMRKVDADELLGMCNVGNQRRSTLLFFLIIPSLVFLILGSVFLLAGFAALLKIRRHVKSDGIKTYKLEVLMVRIGIFSMLYIVPASCVTACNLYEYINREYWHRADSKIEPNVEIFMLKTFMSLVVGITSGVWIWSVKTLQSWRNFLYRRHRSANHTLTKTPSPGPGAHIGVGGGHVINAAAHPLSASLLKDPRLPAHRYGHQPASSNSPPNSFLHHPLSTADSGCSSAAHGTSAMNGAGYFFMPSERNNALGRTPETVI